MEIFKISNRSKCHGCSNINEVCNMRVTMVCDTDNKIGKAFVKRCGNFNKEIVDHVESKRNVISVAFKPDSRVEMMGGGHDL